MTIGYNHIVTRVRPGAVVHNFNVMNALGGNGCAVIKSDAYGHGLAVVAEALAGAGARTLAVGTVGEALDLGRTSFTGRVIALLGPQLPEDYEAAARKGVVCFCARREQLEKLSEAGRRAGVRVPVALKFDTGMRRLGFLPDEAGRVLETVLGLPGIEAVMAASHLAVADEPQQEPFVREQAARFAAAVSVLRAGGLRVQATLANSAAILAYPELHLDLQRPGIALYGANPFWGTARQELGAALMPAMETMTRVYQVHDLKKGETISYGRTFTAGRDMRVAIIGAGYADAWSRALSNRGQVLLHGLRAPVVGRVCMQMTAVDVTDVPQARAGDRVWLLGGPGPNAIRSEELAQWWGTISYEVLCLLGMNRREYILDSPGENE
ncbi:alanine racemase [Desulfocurvus vexinensis]|uniref:alanine racemase n=1 Tax=Desulfocurvus vexinensis TaxID=399548 RepID=UPI00048E5075|nr:alanine racemase [Desulfocurvus vexinensis]